jgi:gliding motility-associated lipoprotein GldH
VKKIVSSLIIILFILSSCGPNAVYEGSYDFNDHSWGSGESPSFSYVCTNTTDKYNFIVTLRTTTDYEYSNLWVFMYTKNPSGELRKDTLNFPLAELNGKWLGKNTGSLIEHEILIGWNKSFLKKVNIKFVLNKLLLIQK